MRFPRTSPTTRRVAAATHAFFPARSFRNPSGPHPLRICLPYIPLPNDGPSTFTTGAYGEILRDDKGSLRIDADAGRWGSISVYDFFDDYHLNNPYPTGQGGATVPGFAGLNLGRSQLISAGDTKTFGPTMVNEFRISFMRDANNVGQPAGGVGPSLASQGFVTGVGTPGIVPLDPKIEGVENVIFNSFVMGVPITNLAQFNNTYGLNDIFSKVIGTHTLKVGFIGSYEQVNVHPNPEYNGGFDFCRTGNRQRLCGLFRRRPKPVQSGRLAGLLYPPQYYGGFVQDSWRATSSLTLNFGVRWDRMEYWSEKYNQIPTFIPGEQSQVYTQAFPSLVYVGDKGVPNTLVPSSNRFSPRLGIAYSPGARDGFLSKITGGPGNSSIRAGYGIYYSVIEGNTMAIDEPQPPYGLSYTSARSAALRDTIHNGIQRPVSRQSVSAGLSFAEYIDQKSEHDQEFYDLRTPPGHDRSSSMEHLSLHRELLSIGRTAIWHRIDVQRELRRLSGASPAAGLFQ